MLFSYEERKIIMNETINPINHSLKSYWEILSLLYSIPTLKGGSGTYSLKQSLANILTPYHAQCVHHLRSNYSACDINDHRKANTYVT